MELRDKLSAVRSTAKDQLSLLNSKRKSENALLLPFFELLGYHPFDVREVVPDYVIELDAGRERTVDYVLKKDGSPAVFVESKEVGTDLGACDSAPLLRLLKKSKAPIGALTNGIEYHFFADLERFYSVLEGATVPDTRPFLTFDVFHYEDDEVEDLECLTRSEFDADGILPHAHRLKYKRLFRMYLSEQVEEPTEEFVKFLAKQVHDGEAFEDMGMYKSCAREAVRELFGNGGGGEAQGQHSVQGGTKEDEDKRLRVQGEEGIHERDSNGASEAGLVLENHREPRLERELGDT
ncbi:hypothetical protein [Salinibacter altiplanensis]|uniref:hypothetical protein n=1 Tax=Salinibacter altiplanensis TaxID=1803181 RepID=UPI000C9F204E|nr:hypothetical protein [Salinibacter altiplanensis]